jgi:hypothetical protein
VTSLAFEHAGALQILLPSSLRLEKPWARRCQAVRMGPSVNRIHLVNSWTAGLHLGRGAPATNQRGSLSPAGHCPKKKGGKKAE